MTTTYKISKSEVMKRAWKLFRADKWDNEYKGWKRFYKTFGQALKDAWRKVKSETAEKAMIFESRLSCPIEVRVVTYSKEEAQALHNYYHNAPVGVYFGD